MVLSQQTTLCLYEYCLGFGLGTFHVDSRRNLFYRMLGLPLSFLALTFPVKADWHIQFDTAMWILLPATSVLEDIRRFIQSVISARKDPAAVMPAFYSKVSPPFARINAL